MRIFNLDIFKQERLVSKLNQMKKKSQKNKKKKTNKYIDNDNSIELNLNEEFNNNIINFNNKTQENYNTDLNETLTENDSEIEESDKIINLFNKESKKQYTGRWSEKEKKLFLEGFFQYINNWKKLNEIIKSRSTIQLRSHAQKVLMKIKNIIKNFQNIHYVKNKLGDFFQEELKEKYNPIYLNKFTLYIIKIFSPKKSYLSTQNLYNLNINRKDYLNNNNYSDNFKNKEEKNKKNSLYINMLTVNYINSSNNENNQKNTKKDIENNNKSDSQSSNNLSDEFYKYNEHNILDETFYQRFNHIDNDHFEKIDDNHFYNDNF